jgi:hypothetical protein
MREIQKRDCVDYEARVHMPHHDESARVRAKLSRQSSHSFEIHGPPAL